MTVQSPSRPTHPLKAWRQTQRYRHPRWGREVPMTQAEVARLGGWELPVYTAWEKYPDEPGHRMPSHDNMLRLYELTRGQVRPDHFYLLPRRAAPLAKAG